MPTSPETLPEMSRESKMRGKIDDFVETLLLQSPRLITGEDIKHYKKVAYNLFSTNLNTALQEIVDEGPKKIQTSPDGVYVKSYEAGCRAAVAAYTDLVKEKIV